MAANIPIIDLTNSSNCLVPRPASSRIIVPINVQNPYNRPIVLQPTVQNIGSSSGNKPLRASPSYKIADCELSNFYLLTHTVETQIYGSSLSD